LECERPEKGVCAETNGGLAVNHARSWKYHSDQTEEVQVRKEVLPLIGDGYGFWGFFGLRIFFVIGPQNLPVFVASKLPTVKFRRNIQNCVKLPG
jgi:hypothetical protein